MAGALDVAQILKEWREIVHSELVTEGQSSLGASKGLQAATTYVLQAPGKRLRALLALAICSDVTGKELTKPHALKPGVALEMLHAASLVHDDLPALDNDDMRRGRPSCHRQFTEATAILTGDYLVGRAFGVVTEAPLTAMQQLRILTILARAWGELCMGQQADIEKPTEAAAIQRLMELKTGALFGAAAASGALCADVDDRVTALFYGWGVRLGVLFQRLDDLADGDGAPDPTFNKDFAVASLFKELRALSDKPLPLTEAVYKMVVGEALP
jgi:farnesyl diphosphate synthase